MSISGLAFLKRSIKLMIVLSLLLIPLTTAFAQSAPSGNRKTGDYPVPDYEFVTPIFGLATAHNGNLLVADAGQGVVQYRNGKGHLFAALPGVTDMAPGKRGSMFAVTGLSEFDNSAKLFDITKGKVTVIADLWAFEEEVNPDGGEVDSNPFDVAALTNNTALVADAGGNSLLVADKQGNVDWVAIFPDELASTEHIKNLVGCPAPGFEFVCDLPDMIPAQSVPTSVAIGPDGAYYVGELKGFPAPVGMSRVWRIEPGTMNADCATSSACSVVMDGFTSIVDLTFGPDGTLYVVEMDEATWAAVEFGLGGEGGTVNACNSSTWTCTELATGLPIPMAATIDRKGKVNVAILALVPGEAGIIQLP